METKNGVCTEILHKKTGTGQYGEYHIFSVSFTDKDGAVSGGDYMAKKNPQQAFIVGKEYSYEYEEKINGQYTNKTVKPAQNQQGVAGKFTPKNTKPETALLAASHTFPSGSPDEVLKTADKYLIWLNSK